jgi:hypothetical protein
MANTPTKEQLAHIAELMNEGKQKIAEAACYAGENNLRVDIRLFGEDLYLENLNDRLSDYDLNDERQLQWYNRQKEEFEEMFGVSEGYVWASSSTFC